MICAVMTLHHDHYLKLLALTCINREEIKYRYGRESAVIISDDIFQNKIPQYSSFQSTVFSSQSLCLESQPRLPRSPASAIPDPPLCSTELCALSHAHHLGESVSGGKAVPAASTTPAHARANKRL